MASPEELTPLLPETLPEDFGEWDSEASPEPLPIKPGEWEAWEATHSFGSTKKPNGQFDNHDSNGASPVEKPHASGSTPSAPVIVAQQKHFIDWDGESSPAPTPKPVNLSEWEAWEAAHSFGKAPKAPKQSAEREASLSPVVERPAPFSELELTSKPANGANGSSGRASLLTEPDHATSGIAVATELPKAAAVNGKIHSPEAATTLKHEDGHALFQSFSPKSVEVSEEPKTAKKKWMIIAPVSAGSVLLLLALMIPMFHHGAKPAAKQSVQPTSEATEPQTDSDTTNTPENAPAAQANPVAKPDKQPATTNQVTTPAGVKTAQAPTKKQAQMMDDQLTAPTVIPQGAEKQDAENAPPPVSFGSGGADGMGGTSANVSDLNGHAQSGVKVVPSRPFAISSGIATGMLIRQTQPIYPSIAKAARVSGTVELHATISKDGTIKDLQVVNGPAMLRQAAADAVRTWRYKPYKLNNQPVEVETEINVVFSPGK